TPGVSSFLLTVTPSSHPSPAVAGVEIQEPPWFLFPSLVPSSTLGGKYAKNRNHRMLLPGSIQPCSLQLSYLDPLGSGRGGRYSPRYSSGSGDLPGYRRVHLLRLC